MKNNYCLVSLAILLIGLTTVASAQRKAITAKDFKKVDDKAKRLMSATSYRVTTTTKWFSGKGPKPVSVIKSVVEYVPPDRTHTLVETAEGGKITKTERIMIGERRFEKLENGQWGLSPKGSGPWLSSKAESVEYFFLNGRKVDWNGDIVEVVKKMKRRNGNKEEISTYTATYWYGTDGRLARMLSECEDVDSQCNTSFVIYEYDQNIKIEAPIK